MKILGIETSCDDTGIAIYDRKKGILINYIKHQKRLYNMHGGIIPELAARQHMKSISFLLKKIFLKKKFVILILLHILLDQD